MVRWLQPEDVPQWVSDVLLSESREKPVVAVTTQPRSGRTWLVPEELAAALGEAAEVVCLITGEATWELTDALPPRLDVYGGAVRVWWPGLRTDSDPYDHRLYFIRSPREGQTVAENVVEAILGSQEIEAPETVVAKVCSIHGTHVELEGGRYRGRLKYTDVPIWALARCLDVGTELPVRPIRAHIDGRWDLTAQALLPSPWECAAEGLRCGDVVTGRVCEIREKSVFVEVLPQVRGIVFRDDIDWSFVKNEDIPQFVELGQILPVKVLEMNAEARKLRLSIKEALPSLADPAKPLPSLVPGGRPFTWPATESDAEAEGATEVEHDEQAERIAALENELEAANDDRRQLREKKSELARDLRSMRDQMAHLERRVAPELDPLSSEPAFLLAVRLSYARMFDEGTRIQHPLQRMRIGPEFLTSVRQLDGVELDKVIEVAAQVAAGMAHEVEGRDVHQLRDGPRGAGSRVRARDNATAWRCALQVNTPSARRLHWWAIPGKAGQTIEFASVGLHDDFSIPE